MPNFYGYYLIVKEQIDAAKIVLAGYPISKGFHKEHPEKTFKFFRELALAREKYMSEL